MTSIIISGHGQLPKGLLDAFQMIYGEDDQIVAVSFLKGEGIPQLQEKYRQILNNFKETNDVLFMVDVFGGTPYNAASQLIFEKTNMDIVTGVSLPLLLEVAGMKDNQSINQLVGSLKNINQESFKIFSEEIEKIKQNNVSEEDLL